MFLDGFRKLPRRVRPLHHEMHAMHDTRIRWCETALEGAQNFAQWPHGKAPHGKWPHGPPNALRSLLPLATKHCSWHDARTWAGSYRTAGRTRHTLTSLCS